MNLSMDVAKDLLGRSISDSYGATIGKIVGISTDVKNKVTSVEVELGNGQFLNCLPSQIVVNEKGITLLEEWRLEADSLKTEFDLAIRRMRALSDLHRQGDIQPEIYEDFRRNHELSLKELEARREALAKKLTSINTRLDQQVRELEMFLANNKMQLASGEIDPQAYKIATDSVERGLERTLCAKRDIEDVLRNTAAPKSSHLDDRLRSAATSEMLFQEIHSTRGAVHPSKATDTPSL